MTPTAQHDQDARQLQIAFLATRAAALVVLSAGAAVLVGWALHSEFLKSLLHPERVAMNPATAVAFMLSGAALWMLHPDDAGHTRRRAGLASAGLALLIGVSRLLGYFGGLNLHVDQWLFRDRLGENVMAPNTAAAFVLSDLALLLINVRRSYPLRWLGQACCLGAATIALLSLTGYYYSNLSLYRFARFIPMALNTALGFAALSIGILCARPRREPVATVISRTAGGLLARRLLPAAFVVPLLLGWLRVLGDWLELYETDFGVALLAVATIVVFTIIVWWTAHLVRGLDQQRLQAQDQLEESEQRHRAVVEQASEGIILTDADTRLVVETNQALARLLGYEIHQIVGRPVYDLIGDTKESVDQRVKKVLSAKVALVGDRQFRRRDGSTVDVESSAILVEWAGRRVICTVVRDITERKRAQALLEQKNRELQQSIESEHRAHEQLKSAQAQLVQTEKLAGLGQMVAGVAHEINNPLSFVSNNVAVLERDSRALAELVKLYTGADPLIATGNPDLSREIRELAELVDLNYTLENLKELTSRSRDGLKRIQQIVRDLRDFARLDQGDQHEVDLNAGVDSTVNIILGRAKKKQVEIVKELGPLPRVTCHAAKVNQVVMNLLANAIDACPDGGKVTVCTAANDGTIQIAVSDTGPGVPPEIRQRIFDPFFTTKPPGEGTGLGLSISYGIIQDHGGTIEIGTAPGGQGALFTVSLPIRTQTG